MVLNMTRSRNRRSPVAALGMLIAASLTGFADAEGLAALKLNGEVEVHPWIGRTLGVASSGGAFATFHGQVSRADALFGSTVPESDRTASRSSSDPAGASPDLPAATATVANDAAQTFLTFTSDQGDYVGQGQAWTLTPADGTITAPAAAGSVGVHFTGSTRWDLYFAAPAGSALVPGMYEGATRDGFQSPTTPGLEISGEGRGCNTLTGRFVVLDAQYSPTGDVQSLAIDFEQHCEGLPPALFGSVRFNSVVAVEPRISVAPAAAYEGDGEPVSLGFWVSLSERAGVPVSVDYTTVDRSAHAGTDYTAVSGTVTFAPGVTAIQVGVPVLGNTVAQPDRTLALLLSNPTGAELASATATGTILDDDAGRTLLAFDSEVGDWVGQGQAWTLTPLDGPITASTGSNSVSVQFRGSEWWELYFAAPGGAVLVPGVYEGATRWGFQSPIGPGLDVSGASRGCNTLTGRFVVLDAQYSLTGAPQNLAIDFEQHCDGVPAALFGSVRFNSVVSVEPRVSVAPAAAYEGDGEPVSLGFWVSLSERAGAPVSVDYTTVDQSAHAGTDYTAASGTVTFAPGVTAIRVDVPVLGNTVAQPSRTLALSLSNPVGAPLAFPTATGTVLDDDAARTFLVFDSDPGDSIGEGRAWTLAPLDGRITVSAATGSAGVHFYGSTWWDLYFAAPAGTALAPGLYEGATRDGFQSPTTPGLEISGDGRGCNTLTGRFLVLDAQYSPTGEVQSLAIDFEQHCEGLPPALFGSVRFNSMLSANPRGTFERHARRHLGRI
ncbi:MAG: hypothetical protein LAO05_10615 [Acidobacteriia bacterium]|nr:hypothetical protein [Terriglobia bacterium]